MSESSTKEEDDAHVKPESPGYCLHLRSADLQGIAEQTLSQALSLFVVEYLHRGKDRLENLTPHEKLNLLERRPWTEIRLCGSRKFCFVSCGSQADLETCMKSWQGRSVGSDPLQVSAASPRSSRKRLAPSPSPEYAPRDTKIPVLSASVPTLHQLINNRRGSKFKLGNTVTARVTPLMCYSYPLQLEMKQQYARTILKNFTRDLQHEIENTSRTMPEWCSHTADMKGFHRIPLLDIRGAPTSHRMYYRNKCELTIGFADPQIGTGVEVGFVKAIQDNEPCVASASGQIHVPLSMQEMAHHIKEIVTHSSLPVFSRRHHNGVWRSVLVRTFEAKKELMVVVQTTSGYREVISGLLEKHLSKRSFDHHLVASLYIQERDEVSDSFSGGEPMHLIHGTPTLLQYLFGTLKFRVHPESFFQPNIGVSEALYELVLSWLSLKPDSLVLDVCSGTGTISLVVAQEMKRIGDGKVIGIEVVTEAVQDAKRNAELNNMADSVEFYCGKAEEILPRLLQQEKFSKFSDVTAVVDPPRSGLHPLVLHALLWAPEIRRIVYVSCNPVSMAENAKVLCIPSRRNDQMVQSLVEESNNYSCFYPKRAIVFDMFPHTYHAEMVVEFNRLDDYEKVKNEE